MRSQNCEKRLLASSRLSIHPSAWNISAPTGEIFIKFDSSIFRKSVEKVHVSFRYDQDNG